MAEDNHKAFLELLKSDDAADAQMKEDMGLPSDAAIKRLLSLHTRNLVKVEQLETKCATMRERELEAARQQRPQSIPQLSDE